MDVYPMDPVIERVKVVSVGSGIIFTQEFVRCLANVIKGHNPRYISYGILIEFLDSRISFSFWIITL